MSDQSLDFRLKVTRSDDSYVVETAEGLEWQGSGPSLEALLGELGQQVQQLLESPAQQEYTEEVYTEEVRTEEEHTPEHVAESLLSNATNADDYESACAEVRRMGLDPETIDHFRPAGT